MPKSEACEATLSEQWRSIPIKQRVSFPIQWSDDGAETGHQFVPLGYMAHRTADLLDQLASEATILRAERDAAIQNVTFNANRASNWEGRAREAERENTAMRWKLESLHALIRDPTFNAADLRTALLGAISEVKRET